MFEITGKVALITGGGSGIGLAIAKALLENGLRGVAIVDINEENGKAALKCIKEQFGDSKAIFIRTDIGDESQFDNAFKSTVDAFKNLDIVVNSAALVNDKEWEKSIQTTLIGTTTGNILAFEKYLPKFKTDNEAVILNIGSLATVQVVCGLPVYATTKCGIAKLTQCLGTKVHYERNKIRVMIVCPGLTNTLIIQLNDSTHLHDHYRTIIQKEMNDASMQDVRHVSNASIKVIKEGKNGCIWIVTHGKPPYEVELIYRKVVQ